MQKLTKTPQIPLHGSPRVSQGKRPRLPARVSNILQVRCTTSHGTGHESHRKSAKTPLGIRTIFRGKLPRKATNASTRPPKGFVRFPTKGNCPRRPPRICPCFEFWKISPKSFPDNRPRMPSEILPPSVRSLHDLSRLAHNNGHRNWQISPKDFA